MRPNAEDRRQAILNVAQKVFLEDGYANTSMSQLAQRVGGSKATLYNYFSCKKDLFEAFVQRYCAEQRELLSNLRFEGVDPRANLTRLATLYLDIVLADRNIRFFRVVVAEAARAPEVGAAFYESAILGTAKPIAALLLAMAETGALRIADPMAAAQQFMALCQARLHRERLCNIMPEPTAADVAREIDLAVNTFLEAFATMGSGAT